MANSPDPRPSRQLSVRAAAKPLPTPMPPPPRPNQDVAGGPFASQVHTVHCVPPGPHFLTRPAAVGSLPAQASAVDVSPARRPTPAVDPVEPPTPAIEESVPKRSLASPGVILSLAASVAMLCGIGWYEMGGRESISWESLNWESLKGIVQHWAADASASEDDLPYITAVPISPRSGGNEAVARSEDSSSKKSDQVMLSDLPKDDSHGDADHTQLR